MHPETLAQFRRYSESRAALAAWLAFLVKRWDRPALLATLDRMDELDHAMVLGALARDQWDHTPSIDTVVWRARHALAGHGWDYPLTRPGPD